MDAMLHAIRHSGGVNKSQLRPRRQCPSCQPPAASVSETERRSADSARLESIKRQILVKLGLHTKPNVSSVPSRDFILETLLRAEQSLDVETAAAASTSTAASTASVSTSAATRGVEATTIDPSVEDDFFGKTSEIIAFAERGQYITYFYYLFDSIHYIVIYWMDIQSF